MCSQECRYNIRAVYSLGKRAHRKKLANFCLYIQAISRFSLHRGYAQRKHCIQASFAYMNQFLERSFSRSVYAVLNASSPFVHFHIGYAFGAPAKFIHAPTGKNKVSVAIHKPRNTAAFLSVVYRSFQSFMSQRRTRGNEFRLFADP